MKPTPDAELEAEKRSSTAQLLFKCARLVNERALARVAARTRGPALRPAHTALFPYLPLEGGIRPSALAAEVGVTKQAIGQLVDDLEAMGVVERVADPSDARAKLVRFTARGRKGILEGLSVLRELEGELEAAIGARRWRGLHDGLVALHDHLTAGT